MKAFLGVLVGAALLLMSAGFANAQNWASPPSGTYIWETGANWSTGVAPNAVGASVTIDGNTGAQPRTITLDGGNITIGHLTFNPTTARTQSITDAAGGDYTDDDVVDAADFIQWKKGFPLSNNTAATPEARYTLWRSMFGGRGQFPATSTLTFDATGSGPATIDVPEGTSTGKLAITATMVFNDTVVATVNETAVSAFDGPLRLLGPISGPGGFTRLGSGSNGGALVNFEGAEKTYTGPTVIGGGRTRMTAGATPSLSSSFTVSGGAQLELSSDGTFNLGTGNLILNGDGTGLGGAANGGILRPDRTGAAGRYLTINNNVVLQTNSVIHSQTQSADPANGGITFAGIISGPGQLILSSPGHDEKLGTYTLANTNTYSGGTVLNGGMLQVGDPFNSIANLGTGNVTVVNSAAVNGSASSKLFIPSGVSNAIADGATLNVAGGFTLSALPSGFVELGDGIVETVGGLILKGVTQTIPGTYGSSTSGATFQSDELFAGNGVINLVLPAGSSLGGANVPEPSAFVLTVLLAPMWFASRGRRTSIKF